MNHIFLRVIAPASILIPLVVAPVTRKQWSPALAALFYFLLFSGVINIVSTIMAAHKINNLPLLHLYTAIEFCAFGSFYYLAATAPLVKKGIGILIILFPILCLLNTLFLQPLNQFNSNVRTLEAILVALMSLFYLGRPAAQEKGPWSRDPCNWVSTGVLLYFSGSLFLFSFANVLIRETSAAAKMVLWNLHGGLVIVMYLLMTKAYQVCKS